MERKSLAGQHALVTGAGRGIGAAIALRLAALGADVTLAARTLEDLQTRSAELHLETGIQPQIVVLDVTDAQSVQQGFASAKQRSGPITILINNAGVALSQSFLGTTIGDWTQMLDVNLLGAVRCINEVLADMRDADYGRIVNIASTAGLKGYRYVTAYSAAKHAVVGLTRSLALELAATKITVNAVCPGFTDTDLVAGSIVDIVETTGRTAAQARASLERYNPQRRLIDPDEVANVVGWICDPASGSITGQSIAVAGGEIM